MSETEKHCQAVKSNDCNDIVKDMFVTLKGHELMEGPTAGCRRGIQINGEWFWLELRRMKPGEER